MHRAGCSCATPCRALAACQSPAARLNRHIRAQNPRPKGHRRACGCAMALKLAPFIHGGGQEQGLRSGTLSPAFMRRIWRSGASSPHERMEADAAHVAALWDVRIAAFRTGPINGSTTHRYKGNLNIRRDGLDVARLMSECAMLLFRGLRLRQRLWADPAMCCAPSAYPTHRQNPLSAWAGAAIRRKKRSFLPQK